MNIIITEEILERCPCFVGTSIEAFISNTKYSEELWDDINTYSDDFLRRYTTETLKDIPSIKATRNIYKKCGKDPSRYRPSGEALIRRIINGSKLYQINTAVDLINLASIRFGYSIGGFDADKIESETLTLGIGLTNEPYIGIGRGQLNIEGLPVYRDSIGGIGTPTSDHERTKITDDTSHLLVLVNGYDGNEENVRDCALFIKHLLEKYVKAVSCKINLYK